MQKCKNCGKEIKWVATTKETSVMCEKEQTEVYTLSGHKAIGYPIHKCKVLEERNERK